MKGTSATTSAGSTPASTRRLVEDVEVSVPMFDMSGERVPGADITRGLSTFDRPIFLALGRYDFIVAPPRRRIGSGRSSST